MNLNDRLNMRCLRVSSERGMESEPFVQYLALMLIADLKNHMKQANLFKDYTLDDVLEAFNRVECFVHHLWPDMRRNSLADISQTSSREIAHLATR